MTILGYPGGWGSSGGCNCSGQSSPQPQQQQTPWGGWSPMTRIAPWQIPQQQSPQAPPSIDDYKFGGKYGPVGFAPTPRPSPNLGMGGGGGLLSGGLAPWLQRFNESRPMPQAQYNPNMLTSFRSQLGGIFG